MQLLIPPALTSVLILSVGALVVLLFTASGTGGMDAAVSNTCSPGDRVLVVSAGNFGERWLSIAAAYGCEVQELRYSWGEVPSPDDVGAKLEEIGGAHAVFLSGIGG